MNITRSNEPTAGAARVGRAVADDIAESRAEQVRVLYAGVPASLVANAFVGLILLLVQGHKVATPPAIGWLVCLALVLGARALLFVAYRRAALGHIDARAWLRRFRVSIVATGMVWGLASLLLFPANDVPHQAFLAFVLAGVTAGAITSLAIDLVAALAFTVPALLPLIARLFAEGEEIPLAMGAMVALYLAFIGMSAVRMHRTLQESESRFRTMADGAPALIWLSDTANLGIWYNQRWLDYTGRTMEQELGAGWVQGVHPDDLDRAVSYCNEAFEARRTFEMELRLRRADGSYGWIADTGIPRFDAHGKFEGYIGYCWDITDRKQAEEALIAAKDEAERANMAKSRFLSSMSHELRTPLNAVLGFAQVMEMDAGLPQAHRENIGEILKAGQHLLTLINEVLDLAKIESGSIELSVQPVALPDVVDECLALTRPLAEARGIRIESADCSGIVLRADALRLKQVLLNLLSNAIKYNLPGGQVRLHFSADGQRTARIMVSDNGPGIPAERLGELFQPFNRLGAEAGAIQGSGIGLTISRQLAELMGGEIGVESAPGSGSTFWVELPQERSQPVAQSAERLEAPGAQRNLLYVDDNLTHLKQLSRLLGQRPHIRLMTAHTPQIGVELAAANPFDLILLDIDMPGMDGFQVLAQLRERGLPRNAPVVALTANGTPRGVERGVPGGFAAYVARPIDMDCFFGVLDTYLKPVPGSPSRAE